MNRMGGNFELRLKYKEWIDWDRNPETRAQIQKYFDDKDYDSLKKRLLSRIVLGTECLCGRMDAGFYGINDLVVIQTSQGLASYCLKTIVDMKKKNVVIGFDIREGSRRFAELAALAFVSNDITVHLFSNAVPTPLLSYAVLQLGCACGVMITGGHRPKEENGYRIYWENGALINTPHDKAIQDSILANLKPWQSAWEFSLLNSHHVVRDSLDEVISRYLCMLTNNVVDSEINTSSTLKFTYTVLHGIGYTFMSEAFKACGFNCVTPVEPQMYPDPSFPTIRVPDPNEGNEVFDLAIKTADENFSSIVLAVDPDAQCLGVAEKLENNQWRIFSGDEIGALLGCWMWNCYKTENPDCNPSNVYMISSAVSSKILRAIAKAEGFNFEETLPGFKWMANKAEELLLKGKIVLFVFEEALGFMCGTSVLERDAIASAMQVTQLAAHLHNLGMTLDQELRNIYSRYGLHMSRNSCFICHHWPTILSLFERIREYGGYNTYPTRLGHYSVLGVRDLTAGVDTTQEDHHPILPTLCSCQMITFYFKNNFQVTLRTDEVEPKIKYNIELCALPDQGDWTFLEKELNNLEKLVVREWLRPDSNRLILHSESKE